jgi:hypothetical protein
MHKCILVYMLPTSSHSYYITFILSSFRDSVTNNNGFWIGIPGYRFRGLGFDSRRYQIFWEVVGLERGPLSLVSTIEELLGRNSSGSGLENREYGRGDPLRWPRDTLYPQKLALISPTCGGRSVGIVRLRNKATVFIFLFWIGWENTAPSVVCSSERVYLPTGFSGSIT